MFKFFAFLNMGIYFQLTRLWKPLIDTSTECEHPALPGNNSGVKVLVAAFAKMGTRTMSRSLYQLGLTHSYHSEEISLHVWSDLAAKFWRRPENAGVKVPVGMPYVGRTTTDLEVLAATRPGELAAALSRCKVDAMAFDGLELLFWPVYEVSPDAKVIVLNWRTWQELLTSSVNFAGWFSHLMYIGAYLSSSMHALPWGAAFHALDPLVGRPIQRLLSSGGAPVNQEQGPLVMLWYRMMSGYRVTNHFFHGLGAGSNATFYGMLVREHVQAEFFERVHREVPPERRLDFDPRKQGYEDLCKFLEISNCPRRGLLPRAVSVYAHERDFPLSFAFCVVVYVVLHWANWKIYSALLSSLLGALTKPKVE